MKTLEFMVTNDFFLADDNFLGHLRRVTRASSDAEYNRLIDDSLKEVGRVLKYIGEKRTEDWQPEKLEDGREALVLRYGESAAYAIPQNDFSPATLDTLRREKVELSEIEYHQEVLLLISTPKIDFGNTWAFYGHSVSESWEDMTHRLVTELAVEGFGAVCKAIFDKIEEATTNFLVGVIQKAIQGKVTALIVAFAGAGKLAALAVAAVALIVKFIAVIIVVAALWAITTFILFQKYRSFLLVFNITGKNLKYTIPYLYNASDRTLPNPAEVNHIDVTFNKVTSLRQYGDLQNIRLHENRRAISIGALQMESGNTFLQGTGWLVKLENPDSEGFSNVVAMLSVPRIGGASISLLFNETRTDYEDLFNDQSGTHCVGEVQFRHNRFEGSLTSREEETDDGYSYFNNLVIADTDKYPF